jgi:hypothetical protein
MARFSHNYSKIFFKGATCDKLGCNLHTLNCDFFDITHLCTAEVAPLQADWCEPSRMCNVHVATQQKHWSVYCSYAVVVPLCGDWTCGTDWLWSSYDRTWFSGPDKQEMWIFILNDWQRHRVAQTIVYNAQSLDLHWCVLSMHGLIWQTLASEPLKKSCASIM